MFDNKYKDGVYYNMSDKEYRSIERDSYSTLKDYLTNREDYYKKYCIKEPYKIDYTTGMIIGSIIDHKFTSKPEDFDNVFQIEAYKKPTGQWEDLVNKVCHEIDRHYDKASRTLQMPISEILKTSYTNVAYNYSGERISLRRGKKELTLEESIKELESNGGMDYIKQYLSSQGKIMYNSYHEKSSENCISILKTHRNTSLFFGYNSEEGSRYDVYNQLTILFTYKGRQIKSRLDRVIVDNETKKITLLDLKASYDNSQWLGTYYKMKYYIQASLYTTAVQWLLESGEWSKKYPGYTIDAGENYSNSLFTFVTVNYTNNNDPLLFVSSLDKIKNGLEGWIDVYGKYIPGVDYVIECLKWHEKENIWSTDMYLYNNKGIVEI